MGIYTRGGDTGQTSLLGGSRVPKDTLRIEVYGTVDEATSTMGLARAMTQHTDLCQEIIGIQGELIGLMAELADKPGAYVLLRGPDHIQVSEVVNLLLRDGSGPERLGLDKLPAAVQDVVKTLDGGLVAGLSDRTFADLLKAS